MHHSICLLGFDAKVPKRNVAVLLYSRSLQGHHRPTSTETSKAQALQLLLLAWLNVASGR